MEERQLVCYPRNSTCSPRENFIQNIDNDSFNMLLILSILSFDFMTLFYNSFKCIS